MPRALAFLFLIWVLPLSGAHGQNAPASFNQNVLSCSPAPCVFPPTQASEGGGYVVNSPIVADPINASHLLLGSNDDNCFGQNEGFAGFHFSKDGGYTWTHKCMSSVYNGWGTYTSGDGPMAGFDRKGAAYVAAGYGFSFHQICYGMIGFQKSTDGAHWSKPMVAVKLETDCARPYESWLAVDISPESPKVNSVYISTVLVGQFEEFGVVVSHSNDGGNSWKMISVDGRQPNSEVDDYTRLAVGKDGTVYLTWLHCNTNFTCNNAGVDMLFSKSTDGGSTWSSPRLMTKITTAPTECHCPIGDLPNSNPAISVSNYPVIGVDNSNGPYGGSLYVVMYTWTGTHMQVQVIRSTDGGNTWSQPVPVAPPTDTHDQFFPSLSVSSDGLVGVSWLDRRNDPANINYQAFAAVSTDGGLSFEPNLVLNNAFSNPNIGGETYMGDYTGNTWVGPNFVAAWMDSSNGVNMQDVVGGVKLR